MTVWDEKAQKFRNGKLDDKRKQSLYMPEEMLQELQREARRQDRSLSWLVQQAWTVAKGRIATLPASPTWEEGGK